MRCTSPHRRVLTSLILAGYLASMLLTSVSHEHGEQGCCDHSSGSQRAETCTANTCWQESFASSSSQPGHAHRKTCYGEQTCGRRACANKRPARNLAVELLAERSKQLSAKDAQHKQSVSAATPARQLGTLCHACQLLAQPVLPVEFHEVRSSQPLLVAEPPASERLTASPNSLSFHARGPPASA